MERGNQKTFNQNPQIVEKLVNKEDRYSHLLPLHLWVCFLGANFRHNSQGLVIEERKNQGLVLGWFNHILQWIYSNEQHDSNRRENRGNIRAGKIFILLVNIP